MAFTSKIGNLLKQTVNKHIKTELSASNLSLYQAVRFMSSSKLFVGGLSYGTDDTSLREAFSSYGEVIEARVIMDRETGRSRGFGFVSFTSGEEATTAISAMDGKDLHGRMVRVNYATDRTGGFRGGGGGYGGGYGGGGDYGGGGNYGGGGGNYGGGGGNYGGGGGNYGGGGGNYGGGGGNYGSGGGGGDVYGNSSGGGNTYGGSGSGSGGGSYGVASDDRASSGGNDWNIAANTDSFTSGGSTSNYSSNGGISYGASDPFESKQSGINESQDEPLEGNYRDGDDKANDYANRG